VINIQNQLKLALAATALLASVSMNADVNDEIADRIKRVGSVCLQGAECGVTTPSAASSGTEASGGGVEDNYNKSCATCHAAGIAGAPKLGDAAQWASRVEKGMDVLYSSAINGMPPGMPAKGMCFQCSDDDLKALVDYMVETAQ
jgi:cytochrome c5